MLSIIVVAELLSIMLISHIVAARMRAHSAMPHSCYSAIYTIHIRPTARPLSPNHIGLHVSAYCY